MSKNATRTSSKNAKTEVPRKVTKSPATSGSQATTREPKERRSLVRQPDSLEGEKIARKTTTATQPSTSKKPLSTGKNKEREALSKRTTPSPGALRASTTTRQATTNPPPSLQSRTKTKPVTKAKPNAVLDTYHSVTVASPPQKRKQEKESPTPPSKGYSPVAQAKKEHKADAPAAPARARTFTRTLDPEEVVVLKRESAKQRSQVETQESQPVKQPVAFEVKFEEKAKKPDPESDHYSDDFESYESDFETDDSTPGEDEEPSEPSSSEAEVEEEPEEEDSEPTQNPITVIQRDKDQERKLDSGHYDMHLRRNPLSTQSTQNQYDSFDTNSMANSEQLDSGISTTGAEKPPSGESNVYYGGYSGFVSHPVITRRGEELMAKLRFDQLNYQLFEMKPLSYEGFMQSYGKLNACQLATQTQLSLLDGECQTLEVHSRSSWTQHPPHYGGQLILSCSGDADIEDKQSNQPLDKYEASLSRLEQLHRLEQTRSQQQQHKRLAKTTDLERLNTFLHKAARLMGRVLEGNKTRNQNSSPRNIPLQTGLLNALPCRRIFGSSGNGQLVVTVHECPQESNVYREDFASLLMVWSLANPGQPLRLLSTWAEVSRVVISGEAQDIVVAGLRDGSVAMWDLRETHSYCSKLDGHLTHFAATQSVVPMMEQKQQEANAMDLGAVVDVRSFRPQPKGGGIAGGLQAAYKEVQYASLNDCGLLTMWTLVEGASSSNSHEFSSPWARVKLLQSASCDLRSYLERRLQKSHQSAYEKTKSLFQGNIYSDDLLRELNETQTLTTALQDHGLQGLRFTSIDTGSDLIYVCTNRNFVLCCTRSLKTERFSRIAVNESRFLFPTSLCVLSNENYVAVGLSNGSVMILNCNQRQRQQRQKNHQRPKTAVPPATDEPDPETGKSCAIQNIILNERRSFDQQVDVDPNSTYDPRPNTALEQIERPRRSYEMRVFDQQLLLSGSGLRQHLVQALILSSDGWRLSALTNGTVRTYDFYRDREMPGEQPTESRSKVTDIAGARSSGPEQILLILDATGKVQVNTLDY
ncbi:cytoplasmic dynein 2 intermediate chain 1 [Drosophila takahashii]|uniref:cytoplasmic dynein 2 intermediate chain 1 n=1 Tax=Drosophila takahashii TaxID=29030 RepID=UPI001CF91509|nr:cytoplasmic dynein 2 intermediate chain 1 [Drosophila takahashii]